MIKNIIETLKFWYRRRKLDKLNKKMLKMTCKEGEEELVEEMHPRQRQYLTNKINGDKPTRGIEHWPPEKERES